MELVFVTLFFLQVLHSSSTDLGEDEDLSAAGWDEITMEWDDTIDVLPPLYRGMMNLRIDRESFVYNSSLYGNWSEWSECDFQDNCVQFRQKTCLDDSWTQITHDYKKNAGCNVMNITERRTCHGAEFEKCLETKNEKTRIIEQMMAKCGTKRKSARTKIAGGEPVDPNEWPWFFHLSTKASRREGAQTCGATLITENHAITAAHCVESLLPKEETNGWQSTSDLDGLISIDQKLGGKLLKNKIVSLAVNPTFKSTKLSLHTGLDLAILKLAEPVNASIPCLATKKEDDLDSDDLECWAIGYGKTPNQQRKRRPINFDFDFSNMLEMLLADPFSHKPFASRRIPGKKTISNLHQVKLPLRPLRACEKRFGKLIQGYHICAGALGKDTCSGDSGGGLYCRKTEDKNTWFINGVTSFGWPNCGRGDGHSVYSSVSGGSDWIKEMLVKDILSDPK